MVKLDRYIGSCNTLNDLSNKACVPNKTEDLNLNWFNMITGMNESSECICHVNVKVNLMEENVIQINGGIMINVDMNVKKNVKYVKKIMFRISLHEVVKMENIEQVLWMIQQLFAMNLYNDSENEEKEAKLYNEKKTIPKHFNDKKATCIILLEFLLITIALLIAVGIYCYFIKYQAKQKHLLPFQFTNNKLKEIIY